MKLKMTSNFSWTKAINYLTNSKDFGQIVDQNITKPLIEDSKEKIRSNQVTPATTKETLKRRRARKFPPTISDSTLYDTGKLHDSIRLSDKRGIQTSIILKNAKRIEMLEYGKYHQLGMGRNKRREFLDLSIKNADTASSEIMKGIERNWKK